MNTGFCTAIITTVAANTAIGKASFRRIGSFTLFLISEVQISVREGSAKNAPLKSKTIFFAVGQVSGVTDTGNDIGPRSQPSSTTAVQMVVVLRGMFFIA